MTSTNIDGGLGWWQICSFQQKVEVPRSWILAPLPKVTSSHDLHISADMHIDLGTEGEGGKKIEQVCGADVICGRAPIPDN